MMACEIWDVGCKAGEGVFNFFVPYILPALLVLVALFILPRAGKKGWVLALLVIVGVVLWYAGIPNLIPPLRQGFGW